MPLTRFRKLHDVARRLLPSSAGSTGVVFALTLPIMVGMAGLGIDTGLWYQTKRELQTQADAAALAGAYERFANNAAGVTAASFADAVRNGYAGASIVVNNPPTSGLLAGNVNAVEVIMTTSRAPILSALNLNGAVTITARAVATAQTSASGSTCVLALEKTAGDAIKISGNANVNMPGCVLHSNSSSSIGADFTGNAVLTADAVKSAGGHKVTGSTTVNLTNGFSDYVAPLPDPFETLTIPALGSCLATNPHYVANQTVTLSPGTYCGKMQIDSQATVKLNPGTYYINKGDLVINGQANVTCNCVGESDGVTIILTSNGAAGEIGIVDIQGGATVNLRAPTGDTSNPFNGILFYQDRNAELKNSQFEGNASMNLTGILYFPKGHVEWEGNNGANLSNCSMIVSKTFEIEGNAKLNNQGCDDAGLPPLGGMVVRLVE